MESKCLVAYGDKNIVVTFNGPWKKPDFIANICKSKAFGALDISGMSLKVYDEDFNMYVDVDDDFVIPDKAKLLIKEAMQYGIVDVLEVEEATPASFEIDRTVYVLPNVPLDVKMSIERHERGQYFQNRRRVIQWLYNDISTYKMYPGKLYEEAARALVTKFPTLSDTTGTGYDSWREGLRFKAKYERTKLKEPNDDSTRAKRQRMTPHNNLPLRASRPVATENMHDSEDEDTINAHIAGMHKELNKSSPNYDYLANSMKRTFSGRRSWIGLQIPSVKDVLEKYPALSKSTIDAGTTFIFPTVTYQPGGSVFNATQFIVRLEEISIAESTLLEAVATQIALYWAFDIVFDPKAKRSLDLICRAAHVDSGVSPTPLVRLAAALFE